MANELQTIALTEVILRDGNRGNSSVDVAKLLLSPLKYNQPVALLVKEPFKAGRPTDPKWLVLTPLVGPQRKMLSIAYSRCVVTDFEALKSFHFVRAGLTAAMSNALYNALMRTLD